MKNFTMTIYGIKHNETEGQVIKVFEGGKNKRKAYAFGAELEKNLYEGEYKQLYYLKEGGL